jgi:hypothetical protein
MAFAFDRENSEERLSRCMQCMFVELGQPDNANVPIGDYLISRSPVWSPSGRRYDRFGAKRVAPEDPEQCKPFCDTKIGSIERHVVKIRDYEAAHEKRQRHRQLSLR